MNNVGEVMQFIDLGAVIVSVVGAYFYIKFKLGEVERMLTEHKDQHKEELIQLKASKTTMKAEIQQRYDEKIADLKENQDKVNDGIEKRLDSIESKLDSLILSLSQKK